MWRFQIFCLIYWTPLYAPLIKLEQLAFPIKWLNLDVNIKMIFFFSFRNFCFFSLVFAFGFFFFFLFSLLYVVSISSVRLHPHFTPVIDTSISLWIFHLFFQKPILLLLVCGKEILWVFLLPNILRVWCGSKVWRETKWLVYGDNGVWFLFH